MLNPGQRAGERDPLATAGSPRIVPHLPVVFPLGFPFPFPWCLGRVPLTHIFHLNASRGSSCPQGLQKILQHCDPFDRLQQPTGERERK